MVNEKCVVCGTDIPEGRQVCKSCEACEDYAPGSKLSLAISLGESICKKCGKIFYRAAKHVYKDTKGFYCSWTCFNHRNDKKKKYENFKHIELCSLDGTVIQTFRSASYAECYVPHATAVSIRKACESGKPYRGYIWRYADEKK